MGSTTSRDRDDDAEIRRKAARTAMFGWAGWFLRPASTRRGMDAVSPPTARGTVNVVLWFVALAALIVLGRLLLPGAGIWSSLVAVAVMLVVGWYWPSGEPRDDLP